MFQCVVQSLPESKAPKNFVWRNTHLNQAPQKAPEFLVFLMALQSSYWPHLALDLTRASEKQERPTSSENPSVMNQSPTLKPITFIISHHTFNRKGWLLICLLFLSRVNTRKAWLTLCKLRKKEPPASPPPIPPHPTPPHHTQTHYIEGTVGGEVLSLDYCSRDQDIAECVRRPTGSLKFSPSHLVDEEMENWSPDQEVTCPKSPTLLVMSLNQVAWLLLTLWQELCWGVGKPSHYLSLVS